MKKRVNAATYVKRVEIPTQPMGNNGRVMLRELRRLIFLKHEGTYLYSAA